MFSKILAFTAFVAYAQAGVFELGHGHAQSYSSVSQHQAPLAYAAPVAAYHSAPAIVKTAHIAPVAHYAHAPVAHYAHAPVVKAIHQEVYPDAHPQYSFNYGVQDAHTGDAKNQHESRDGDVVKGEYSIVQPDGITRTVHYSADDHNGFNAEVSYSGHAAHPQQLVQKAVVAAPVYSHAAPVYHH